MTAILGISAFYHDSAAALLVDGDVVAAAQEERFTRKKHDEAFPKHAVEYCLREANLKPEDLDYIAYYEKPLTKFERLLETYLAFAPHGFRSFAMAMPIWLREKLFLRKQIKSALPTAHRAKLLFTDHHESHAASAFFPSPFSEAAILTLDGVGEWCTTSWGVGKDNKIELKQQLSFPHSLGLLYSAVTYHCGFKVNSGEYKLMGLAPYGRPIFADSIRQHLIDIKPDGSFWMDMQYFDYCHGLTMTNRKFSELFGFGPRSPESQLEQHHMDLAASVQLVTEEVVLALATHIRRQSGIRHLVLAGGVALNCVANGKLLRSGLFDDIWIQPASGDAGGALGAALFAWNQLLQKPKHCQQIDTQKGSLLGPAFSDDEILAVLQEQKIAYERVETEEELFRKTSELLTQQQVIGWFQGRMEYGPRALGSRSILGDPRSTEMQSIMNLKIKYRESFRPFAPIVLREKASEWFDIAPQHESPYMLIVADIDVSKRIPLSPAQQQTLTASPDLCERVNVPRSELPAITHVDYSARLQTVDMQRNARLHGLMSEFYRQTGCPVLVNTSFNVRGEPIVCTPADAVRCFLATEMDALVIGQIIVRKSVNQEKAAGFERSEHLARFSLD
jgi:carbamoyltransferase